MRLVVEESLPLEEVAPPLKGRLLLHLLEVGLLRILLSRRLLDLRHVREVNRDLRLVIMLNRLVRLRGPWMIALIRYVEAVDIAQERLARGALRRSALQVAASDGRAGSLGAAAHLRVDAVALGRFRAVGEVLILNL